jgi:hypothetical protein
MSRSAVLRTQLSGVARRPARLLLTGLAMLVASFVVYATVLAQQVTERSILDGLSGTPAAVDLVVSGGPTTAELAKLRALPGVAEAAGRIDAGGQAGGEYLSLTADPGAGPLAVTHVLTGRYPSGPREIAVSPRTADRMGLPVGATVAMTTRWSEDGKPQKPVTLTVVALVDARDDFGSTAYAPQSAVTALIGEQSLQQVDLHRARRWTTSAARRRRSWRRCPPRPRARNALPSRPARRSARPRPSRPSTTSATCSRRWPCSSPSRWSPRGWSPRRPSGSCSPSGCASSPCCGRSARAGVRSPARWPPREP